jgi:hypothetical protein
MNPSGHKFCGQQGERAVFMIKVTGALASAVVVVLFVVGGAAGTTGTLPGGTSYEVLVTGPHNGDSLPANTGYVVSGRANIGAAAPVANTFLTTIIDVSGSTVNPVSTTACGNVNTLHDNAPNTVLDCELKAAQALNDDAIAQGTVANAALIGFAGRQIGTSAPLADEASTLDVGPAAGFQRFTPPATDANGFGGRDLNEVLASAYNFNVAGTFGVPGTANFVGFTNFSLFDSNGNTNYWAAITELKNLMPFVPAGMTKIAVMLSDGESTVGGPFNEHVASALVGLTGVRVYTFAIGNAASCTGSSGNFGTLQEISNATGGTCTRLTNPADAVTAVPDAIGSKIAAFGTSSNGGATFDPTAGVPVPPATITGGIVNGPGSATFSRSYPASSAAPGPAKLCVRATGSDGGGNGTLQDCVDVTFKAPPVITLPGDGPGGSVGTAPEGSNFPLTATVEGATSTTWSASGGTGTCSFGDASALDTSITCTDDGLYLLTLTATDGVNPGAVTATEHLLVTNANPVATLSLSPGSVPFGAPVSAVVSVTDAGSADTQTCSIAWGDGSPPDTGCSASHSYSVGGVRIVDVTVTDDDGGTGTTSGQVDVKAPPSVTFAGGGGSVDEGSPLGLSPIVTGATSTLWSATGGTGTCTFADATAVNTSVTCDDNGTYALTITATDGFGQTGQASASLVVANRAPQVADGVVSPGPHAQGSPVSVSWSFTDAGSNDTHTCSINWGDGSPATAGVVAGGACTGTHSFGSGGAFNSTATITDDDGDSGSDGLTIAVDAPPSVAAGGNLTGNEGAIINVSGLVNDDHSATSLWSATPGTGVDAGAACTFGNPLSPVTTVSCTDDGSWTLTLTGNDGVNPPVSSTATLTLANVAPIVHITGATVSGGSTVNVTVAIADVGANDVLSCSINWGDGHTSVTTPVGGTCTATNTYAGSGVRTVTVTGSDDDGGSAVTSTTVTLNHSPSCTSVAPSSATLWPPNGKFVLVKLSGATDIDGNPLTYTINGVTQDEPTAGAPDAQRVGGASLQLRAERNGTGDGRVYIVSYSVSDGLASCAGTVRVTVVHDQAHAAVISPNSYNSFG